MEADFERRLIRSMSGCSSVSSSPFSSPISSPASIKHSDRFIPLRSLSQLSAFYIDQEQIHKGSMSDRKSFRDAPSTSTNNTNGNNTTPTTHSTPIATDRTKDILTYQTLLQNEMFGTQIDSLYDEQHLNHNYSNHNSNNSHLTNTPPNQINHHETNINAGGGGGGPTTTTTVIGLGPTGQVHSGINVNRKILLKNRMQMFFFFAEHSNTITWFSFAIVSTTSPLHQFQFSTITNT